MSTEWLPVLQGPRVRLRAQRADDVPALFALYSDPQVMRYWSTAPFTHIQQAQEKFEFHDRGVRTGEFAQWAIVRDDDALIGTCSLFELSNERCRWPISTPGAEDFCFCGNTPLEGMPYCSGHHRLAYRPGSRQRVVRA